MEHKEASDRDTAIKIMQKLLDQSIIHHGETGPCEKQTALVLSLLSHTVHVSLFQECKNSFLSMSVCVFAVCDEHREFKDLKLFYRFRKDDGTFPLDNEAKVFMRGQRIYEKYGHTKGTQTQAWAHTQSHSYQSLQWQLQLMFTLSDLHGHLAVCNKNLVHVFPAFPAVSLRNIWQSVPQADASEEPLTLN